MKRIVCLFLMLVMLPCACCLSEDADFVNSYMCSFRENNKIGPRVVSLTQDHTGYYIDMIGGFMLEITWEREENMLHITPKEPGREKLQYIIISQDGVYNLVDMKGNVYQPDGRRNAENEEEKSRPESKYTIDDVLGKWLCKEEKQIIHIMPQFTSHFIYEGGGMGNDTLTLRDEYLELQYTGTFAIEPEGESLKMICTKTGNARKGAEFIRVEDIVDEKQLYGTWKAVHEKDSMLIIDESGVYYQLTHTKGNNAKSTRSGSDSLNYAGDTIYIRTRLTLTVTVKNGVIELETDTDRFIR